MASVVYNTDSRVKIIAFLKKNRESAFSAEDIFAALEADGLAKSTVFRQLAHLSAEGYVKRMADSARRGVKYQYLDAARCSEHLHLVCRSCGKLIHLNCDVSRFFEETVRAARHFELDPDATLSGRCEACINAEAKRGGEARARQGGDTR